MSTVPGSSGLYTAHEDGTLVALVSEGDGDALEVIYARYGPVCYGLARRILGDNELAEDVVQEVFLAVWRSAGRYDAGRASLSTWLLSMTHHKAVDTIRREENLRRRQTAAQAQTFAETGPDHVDDQAWSTLQRERVRSALAALPAPQKEALTLAYFGGYTQREISGLTSTPLGTVKTRMLGGMRRLRGLLESIDGTVTDEGGRA